MTRRPFYWKSRRAWYLKQPRGDGRVKTIRLSEDEAEARAIWEAYFKPRRPPIPVRSDCESEPRSSESPASGARREKRPPVASKSPPERRPQSKPKQAPAAPPESRRPDPHRRNACDRYRQIQRILLVAELTAPLRRGAALSELIVDVREMLGEDFCERTIRRDLDFLERLGLVERAATADGDKAPCRWRWRGGSVRATVAEQMASRVTGIGA